MSPAAEGRPVDRSVRFHGKESELDYMKLLEDSYAAVRGYLECPPESRLEYLSENVFNFTTYDGEKSVLFARKAVEVCTAINNRLTFDYIKEPEQYQWYLLMCNMPFFADKLEWGTSIRGAWWGAMHGKQIEFQSCGLWLGDEQLHQTINFSREEWEKFISAVIEFAAPEMKPNAGGKPLEKSD